MRTQGRLSQTQGRLHFGGALSGRDLAAVNKTLDGLLKLLYPNPETEIPDDDLEWAARLALEGRRRVKEQQKRIGSAEFRNTQFSYRMGEEGVERFVNTPELQSDDSIGTDPLPPGQVWAISPGGGEEHSGLYRIEINEASGSGVKIINRPTRPPFLEAMRLAEQNLYAQGHELVGERDPRAHEFTVQLRALESARSGVGISVAALLAMCSALLARSLKEGPYRGWLAEPRRYARARPQRR